ncbi:MAG: hypothetical protein C4527_13435 [Candidatus Omnitrophota bacterium]|jgi:hypothetical protein|nr:MAG: hypothetical protein C4527_13435 [Candidatus Omnitrophota bacterium]
MLIFFFVSGVSFLSLAGQVHTNLNDLGAIRITFAEQNHYGLGTAVSGTGDFDGDGYRDVAIGAPSYDPGGFGNGYENGAVFIVSGKTLDRTRGEVILSANDFEGCSIIGKIQARVGNALSFVGDMNGDGLGDLAIGTETHQGGYIVFGHKNPNRLISLAEEAGRHVEIQNTGLSVSTAGDFNGDGFADAIFGNPFTELIDVGNQQYHVGSVSLLFGGIRLPQLLDSLIPTEYLKTIPGPAGALMGNDIAGGHDINCDGFSDIFIVAPKGGHQQRGRTVLIYGSETLGESVEYTFIIDQARRFVRSIQDTNGDGYPDILVGGEGGENGTVYLIWGGTHLKGTLKLEEDFNASWGVKLIGAQYAYGVGDLNGDGFGDIAVGIPREPIRDKFLTGRVVFLFGRPQWPETIDIRGLCEGKFSVMDYVIVDGLDALGVFGSSIAAVGDIQGDGFDDVIIGAPTVLVPGETAGESPGSAYIIQGQNLFLSLQSYQSNFYSQKDSSR